MAGQLGTRYIPYTVTTPKQTLPTAPLSTPLNIELAQLIGVQMLIPPGHSGLTGIRLDDSGGTILPFSNPSQWVLGDNRDVWFDLDVQSDARMSWVTFNLDIQQHSHYLLVKIVDLNTSTQPPPTPDLTGLQG